MLPAFPALLQSVALATWPWLAGLWERFLQRGRDAGRVQPAKLPDVHERKMEKEQMSDPSSG